MRNSDQDAHSGCTTINNQRVGANLSIQEIIKVNENIMDVFELIRTYIT